MPEALASMNFNMTSNASLLPQTPTLPLNQAANAAGNNLYGLLTQSGNNQLPQLPLSLPVRAPLISAPVVQTTSVIASTTITSVAAVLPAFATNAPTATSTTGNVFNKALSNKPVEKLPPANVVITSSDPLPNPNVATVQTQQAPLSVTIPSHHIKSTVASMLPIVTDTVQQVIDSVATSFGSSTFSFKPQVSQALKQVAQEKHDASQQDEEDEAADADVEYDPQPDFKPIIPLPDEVEVRTGEEDEEVKFCFRAKLYRHLNKEWKERGIGDIKILKHPDGHSRIIMRRDQTFKVAANHKINSNMKLTVPEKETKGYVWVGNDFADGELKFEKFFVRFKLPETALQFKTAFELAVKEASELEKQTQLQTTQTNVATTNTVSTGLSKSTTFNKFVTSTPAAKTEIFSKTAVEVSNTVANTTKAKPQETKSSNLFGNLNSSSEKPKEAANPFSGFSFANTNTTGSTTSPFAKVFGSINKDYADLPSFQAVAQGTVQINGSETANKSTVSEPEDDYVPDAQFKPVIPLPDLVELNTGEENEHVLFEYRAKLLRFDKSTAEWKERGLGNIKLLQDKQDVNKLRLVMRREQVHKLCCNQRVYKDTKFMFANTASKNAVIWAGPDYSENELVTETLTLRFKTAETTQQFLNAVQAAQAAMSVDGEEQNAKNLTEQAQNKVEPAAKGFGAQFKPKSGSWDCQACYVNNTEDKLYCLACDTPKNDTVPKKQTQQAAVGLNLSTNSSFTFGFANKPAATVSAVSVNTATTTASTPFFFGKPQTETTAATTKTATTTTTADTTVVGFGDKFKPKADSWNCEGCYTNNAGTSLYCLACEHPKDSTVPKKDAQGVINLSNSAATKFSFGFANQTLVNTPMTFGVPKDKNATGDVVKSFNFSSAATSTTAAQAQSTEPVLGKQTFSFSMPMPGGETSVATTMTTNTTSFALDKKDFSFSLKPKSPGSKLNRSAGGGGGDADVLVDEADDGIYNEEENNTYFTPVIPLPDKV